MDRASEHLTAALEAPGGSSARRLLRRVWSIVRALWGDVDLDVDLVVRRRETGVEVLRTAADVGEPDLLLQTVRDDLDTKSVEEFIREWRVVD